MNLILTFLIIEQDLRELGQRSIEIANLDHVIGLVQPFHDSVVFGLVKVECLRC